MYEIVKKKKKNNKDELRRIKNNVKTEEQNVLAKNISTFRFQTEQTLDTLNK